MRWFVSAQLCSCCCAILLLTDSILTDSSLTCFGYDLFIAIHMCMLEVWVLRTTVIMMVHYLTGNIQRKAIHCSQVDRGSLRMTRNVKRNIL